MDMNNLNNMFPKRQISPAAEFLCVCLTAMAMPLVLMGFGVWKVIELIREVGKKEFWV